MEARARDFVHAIGSLFILAVLVVLSQAVLVFVLRGFGNAGISAALFLASVVLSPLLFVGTALLYVDQARASRWSGNGIGTGCSRTSRRQPVPDTVV